MYLNTRGTTQGMKVYGISYTLVGKREVELELKEILQMMSILEHVSYIANVM